MAVWIAVGTPVFSFAMRVWSRAMRAHVRLACALFLLLALAGHAGTQSSSSELAGYVARPDPAYAWREVSTGRVGSVEYAEAILTSQIWRGAEWKHHLVVFRPTRIGAGQKHGFLFIHGGRWRDELENGWSGTLPFEARLFARLAEALGAPLAVVRNIPHQPLFDRTEDALIAYTFDQFLRTGEADWPLLLPMVKAASRGMDAVQELTRVRWGDSLERFTVSGASKRGWTSWLVAAVDNRVAGVAPMVIDMLNLPAQIALQKATFGELSEEVRDYDAIDLPERVDSELGDRLLSIVDPYRYREALTQPKLILLGTNDRYWPLDALKLYWKDLPEPKHVLYVPNQGHGIRDYERLIGALSALHRHTARGETLPRLSWRFAAGSQALMLDVSADRNPHRVLVWSARSPTRDFRDARWESSRCDRNGSGFICTRPLADDAYTAMYAEVQYRERGAPSWSLSTTVCIVEPGTRDIPDC